MAPVSRILDRFGRPATFSLPTNINFQEYCSIQLHSQPSNCKSYRRVFVTLLVKSSTTLPIPVSCGEVGNATHVAPVVLAAGPRARARGDLRHAADVHAHAPAPVLGVRVTGAALRQPAPHTGQVSVVHT